MFKHTEEWADISDEVSAVEQEKNEAISAAALEYEGELFTAHSHAEAFLLLEKARPNFIDSEVHDGFITTTGRFVDRDEALEIAKQTQQVSPSRLKRGENVLDSKEINWFERK
ncbi:MAG: hypothetical protein PHF79_03215 [Candidatus Pacebacteria bacterium]|nr:hypothetical protein [Candidatus Paceibacterota bacterium]